MNDFQTNMSRQLFDIRVLANATRLEVSQPEFEGHLLYERLIELQKMLDSAFAFYVSHIPCCDRDSIVRMDAERLMMQMATVILNDKIADHIPFGLRAKVEAWLSRGASMPDQPGENTRVG